MEQEAVNFFAALGVLVALGWIIAAVARGSDSSATISAPRDTEPEDMAAPEVFDDAPGRTHPSGDFPHTVVRTHDALTPEEREAAAEAIRLAMKR